MQLRRAIELRLRPRELGLRARHRGLRRLDLRRRRPHRRAGALHLRLRRRQRATRRRPHDLDLRLRGLRQRRRRVEVRLRRGGPRLVVGVVDLGDHRAGLDPLVVADAHVQHHAADARRDRQHVGVDLRVVGLHLVARHVAVDEVHRDHRAGEPAEHEVRAPRLRLRLGRGAVRGRRSWFCSRRHITHSAGSSTCAGALVRGTRTRNRRGRTPRNRMPCRMNTRSNASTVACRYSAPPIMRPAASCADTAS